jgi:alkanesulfonate monooxygenase SsuD/methylene tetrahydromethanopterin reductase-like flavin-dependent oxidoreductase (luciferase family)
VSTPVPSAPPRCGGDRVRVGTTLPQFRADGAAVVAAARQAEDVGLDGVFVFDHLWPIGNPEGEVLHSYGLLGALAAETRRVQLGPLVARVGLVPDAVLVNTLVSVDLISGGRLVAGLGSGDALSKAENDAFGAPYDSVADRLAAVRACCEQLREHGIPTWAGGRSPELRQVAADAADGLNVWGAGPEAVADEGGDLRRRAGERVVEVTWGGQVLIGRDPDDLARKQERHGRRPGLVQGTIDEVAAHLAKLAEAGATWAVCAPIDIHDDPDSLETLAGVRARLT